MKTVFSCLCFAILVILTATPSQAQNKVGFVNPQRILYESRIGQDAQEDLVKLGQEKDRRIRKSAKDIGDLKKLIMDGNLSSADRRTKQAELEAMYAKHDRLIAKSNEDIQIEEARLIQFVMKQADVALKKVAKQNGFSMVLTSPDIIGYVESSVDLTDAIIQELNRTN